MYEHARRGPRPSADGDFYQVAQLVERRGPGPASPRPGVRGREGRAHHQSLLGPRRIPVRAHRRRTARSASPARRTGVRLPRNEHAHRRPHHDGARARRLLHRDLPRRAQRPRDGVDLPVRLRRAEAALAAGDGARREDRRVRIDRARGRLRRRARPDHHRAAPRQGLDPERPQAVDRQRDLRRPDGHLGARRRRRSGQGFRGREGHAGLLDREDAAQDGASRRAERDHRSSGLPRGRTRTGWRTPAPSRTRRPCCA